MARITNQGKALIAQKQAAGQPVVIDRFIWAHIPGLDHTQPVNPDEPMPSAGQIKNDAAPTQAGYVNPDLVVYSSVLGSNIGTWSFNWLGLASGDTLVAANYVPEQDKTATTGDDIGNNLTKNFALQYRDAQDTSGVTISADTWMIDWTARLDGIDDRERNANQDIYGRQTFINDGFKVERNGGYTLKAGWGYVAGVRINQAADADLGDPGALPKDVWLDVALEGDITGVVATVTPKFSNTTLTDYTDSAGRVHYLEKIAAINGAGVVTDQRTSVTVADGETLADLFLQKAGPADETTAGTAREATLAEVVAGTLSKIFVSPAKLKAWWDQVRVWDNIKNKPATATRWPDHSEVDGLGSAATKNAGKESGDVALLGDPESGTGGAIVIASGRTPNGSWEKRNDGMLIQYGKKSIPSGNGKTTTIAFPIAFIDTSYTVVGDHENRTPTQGTNLVNVGPATVSGFYATTWFWVPGSTTVNFIAKGRWK
ncbi:hypothetical protein GCM10023116_12940 [Kistimonas scapharcae]|uniref:Tail fiber protein n=1 Tax=Kistimonas scapharcae TaxID=1036133 RepID=A0ABP8UYU9_9GAMM